MQGGGLRAQDRAARSVWWFLPPVASLGKRAGHHGPCQMPTSSLGQQGHVRNRSPEALEPGDGCSCAESSWEEGRQLVMHGTAMTQTSPSTWELHTCWIGAEWGGLQAQVLALTGALPWGTRAHGVVQHQLLGAQITLYPPTPSSTQLCFGMEVCQSPQHHTKTRSRAIPLWGCMPTAYLWPC